MVTAGTPTPKTIPEYPPTVPNMLREIASSYEDTDAIIGRGKRLTYRQLETESAELACGLLASGARKGSRIGILMPNGPDWALAYFAATRIGALAVPMSTLYQAPEIKWVLRHADIDFLFIQASYLNHDYVARLETAFPELKGQTSNRLFLKDTPYLRAIHVWGKCDKSWAHSGPGALKAAAEEYSQIDSAYLAAIEDNVAPSDLLFMVYTSGSTADPKGVAHYQGNVIRHTYQMSSDFALYQRGDRLASRRPFFWVAGLTATLTYPLHSGACLICPETDDPKEILELIETEDLSFITGTQPLYNHVQNDPAVIASDYNVIQLGHDIGGIIKRSANGEVRFLNERIEQKFPARTAPERLSQLVSSFGMTETLAAHTSLPAGVTLPEGKEGGSGFAMPGVMHKLVDAETGEEVPANVEGELLVKGYSLMAGLYKKEREEAFTPDGYYPTGDVCVIDEDGFLQFKTRLGDMVKISGANVAPLEVERVLSTIEGVQESAVMGVPDGNHGMRLVAAVIPVHGATLDERDIIATLKTQLSSYKVPKQIIFMQHDDIPRTGSGKIRKFMLKDVLGAQTR